MRKRGRKNQQEHEWHDLVFDEAVRETGKEEAQAKEKERAAGEERIDTLAASGSDQRIREGDVLDDGVVGNRLGDHGPELIECQLVFGDHLEDPTVQPAHDRQVDSNKLKKRESVCDVKQVMWCEKRYLISFMALFSFSFSFPLFLVDGSRSVLEDGVEEEAERDEGELEDGKEDADVGDSRRFSVFALVAGKGSNVGKEGKGNTSLLDVEEETLRESVDGFDHSASGVRGRKDTV